MNGKYQPGQKVFLTGGNKNLIKEAAVLKYTGSFFATALKTAVVSKKENPGSTLPEKKQRQRS